MSRRSALAVVLAAGVALPAALATAHPGDQIRSADLPAPGWESYGRAPAPMLPAAAGRTTAPADLRGLIVDEQDTPGELKLLGHEPLLNRGMNAAIAVHETSAGTFVYVGSRTDGSKPTSGVAVVDATDPKAPALAGMILPPNQSNVAESSRELRVLPEQDLLMVVNHGCSELIHACVNGAVAGANLVTSNIRFYDIAGAKARKPELVSTYLPSRSAAQQPHEVFLWNDPQRPGRSLLYMTTPAPDTGVREQMIVTDISGAREGRFVELSKWFNRIRQSGRDNRLHSLTVSPDGTRAYLAYLGGGFLVADTSDFTDPAIEAPEMRLVTPVADRVFWTNPGAHSAIKVPGQDVALVTDEVYGELGGLLSGHGCPWGWIRMIDIADETKPQLADEYRLPANDPNTCASTPEDRNNFSSFASHNPTLTRNLAFVTWHSAGLQVVDISNARAPKPAAQFVPTPLAAVVTEDPALSSGRDKVVMWSFPIIHDGLVYVVDLRNGLYILEYDGPFKDEVKDISFLDGNSNSGDAARLEAGE